MREVYIDIDVKFESFKQLKVYELIKQNIPIIRKKFGDFDLWMRRSSSGNVHMRLDFYFDSDLTVLEHFQVRSMMHDDIYRIGIDLRRLTLQGENEINRIFDMKAKNGKIYRASPWILSDYDLSFKEMIEE